MLMVQTLPKTTVHKLSLHKQRLQMLSKALQMHKIS